VVLALVIAVGASCGSGNVRAAEGDTLTSSTWVLTPASLGLPSTSGAQPTLRFTAGIASGFSGCNQYHGSYTVKGNALTFGPMATTMMACGPQETAVEAAYLDRLARAARFAVTSSRLDLADAKGVTLLSYAAASSSLEGAWTVTGYLTSTGTAFTSVVVGSELGMSFAGDGTLNGTTGCNHFTGTWRQGPGDAVAIQLGGQTTAACTDPDLMAQETSIVKAWSSTVKVDVAGSEATFYNSDGQRTVTAQH
jgi:heat shock protein HslJ